MKDIIKVGIGIFLAFLTYTVFSKISPLLLYVINIFSLVVIYFAVQKDEIFGACLGAFCGLVQDSFSLGVFGVAGISKTITGFLAGYLSKKINVLSFLRSFLLIFVLISIEFAVWAFLYSFIFSARINTAGGLIFLQPVTTAFLGSLIFFFQRRLKKGNFRPFHE